VVVEEEEEEVEEVLVILTLATEVLDFVALPMMDSIGVETLPHLHVSPLLLLVSVVVFAPALGIAMLGLIILRVTLVFSGVVAQFVSTPATLGQLELTNGVSKATTPNPLPMKSVWRLIFIFYVSVSCRANP